MDDKDLEKNNDWEFDGKAPTIENEIQLDDEYEVDIPENETEEAVQNDEPPKKDESKPAAKLKFLPIILAALVALGLIIWGAVSIFTPNANEKMTPGNTAMKIGDTKISVGMYNYYYTGTVSQYLQDAQYGNNNIDPTVDFAKQFTTDEDGNEISWLDVFKRDTIKKLQYNVAYYEEAVKNGVTLTEQQKAQIDEYIKGVEETAANEDMSVNAFLQENYGEYCGLATFRKVLEQSSIGRTYNLRVSADNKYDEAALEKHIEDNSKKYSVGVFAGLEIMGNGTDEKSISELEARVEKYKAQIKDVKSLKALIPEASAELIDTYINSYGYFKDEKEAIEGLEKSAEMKIPYTQLKEQFSDEIADWLMSDDGIGEIKSYVNKEYGFAYIFYKTGKPAYSDTEYFSVRHILVFPKSADEAESEEDVNPAEKTYTEEEWNEALEKANAILEEYKAGEQTELAFAFLAEEKSEDVQSTTKGNYGLFGGAMEGVGLGQMVPEFEKWATDKSHKYGDVGIVKTQFGYHIMFYIFDGPEYRFNALYDMKAEKIAEIEKKFAEEYTVDEKMAMKKVKVAEPSLPETTEASSQNTTENGNNGD